jgi:hypothetical protein
MKSIPRSLPFRSIYRINIWWLLSLPCLAFKQCRRIALQLKTIIQSRLQTEKKKAGAFEFIWDGRSIHDFDDVDLRHPISHTTIRNGSKVYMEYTVEAWSYEKKGKERADGCRLTLLSIGLVESPHSNCDFDSARTKRRMEY